MGQVETDEVYVCIDRWGAHYVVPLQAKGGSDTLNIVQIEQDVAMCTEKFSSLNCRPVAAQFMAGEEIALFECEIEAGSVRVRREAHYQLVIPNEMTEDELAKYWDRSLTSRNSEDY